MKPVTFFGFIFIILFSSFVNIKIDQSSFYEAFSGKAEGSIDEAIAQLEKENGSSLHKAYQGALLMKKADFIKGVNAKIKTFKKGAHMLEEEIAKSPSNIEYRFLRLAVQEHAPKILKYNKNIEADKKVVVQGYKSLDPQLKKIIKNYALQSKEVKVEELR